MRIDLLGPLRVRATERDEDLTPRAQKLRRTTALLAINAGRVVTVGDLMDELWVHDPPSSAHTALHTYVYQLRKQLSLGHPRRGGPVAADAPLLDRVEHGYRLRLPDGAVDVLRCERLLARARAAFDQGDVAGARDTAITTLALWRGDALVDVRGGPRLTAAGTRLDALRAEVLHLRIESDLQLGRHREVVGELTSIAEANPIDERLHGQLMIALHRLDRRTEALEVHRRIRVRLASELGLDPSPQLRAVHTAVLRGEVALPQSAAHGNTASVTRVPSHVPAPREHLIGRAEELARITRALAGPSRLDRPVVVVGGAPGTGKSELCRHAAERVGGAYPDGRLHARLRDDTGRRTPVEEVVRSFLRGLGAEGTQLDLDGAELGRLFRTWTADLRVLVVLDDVCEVDELMALLPAGAGCGVIVGSRRRLFLSSSTVHLDLDVLSPEDGLRLLEASVPADRVATDPVGLRRTAQLCHGLPAATLAVASVLRRRPHWTARHAASWLRGSWAVGGEAHAGWAGLDRTLATLSTESRALATVLVTSEAPQPLTPTLAAGLLGVSEQRAEDLLEELSENFLLRARPTRGDGRFSYAWERGTGHAPAAPDRPSIVPCSA